MSHNTVVRGAVDLGTPEGLHRFLRSQGINPDKGLGQHFLCSPEVVETIVNSVGDVESVLEIGPGPGVLTVPLSTRYKKVLALEVDHRMAQALKVSAPAAEVLLKDAMQVDLSELLRGLPHPVAIVSNLPYYITSPLIQRIAECRADFTVAVLMMQKEVASRILAPTRSGERGSLSVYLQAVFQIDRITEAPADLFVPPPKVDSSVLRFIPHQDPLATPEVLAFVRLGFANPRKTLANVLAAGLRLERSLVLEAIETVGLLPTARAQELTLGDWSELNAKLMPGPLDL